MEDIIDLLKDTNFCYYYDESGVLLCGDIKELLNMFPEQSIDLIVSSPPYYNLRDYAQWATYEDHIKDIGRWFHLMNRCLKSGRHICWNIQDNIPEPSEEGRHYYPLMPDTIRMGIRNGFEWERNVIWNKQNATQIMFGSYPYPPNIIYSAITESICMFRKQGKTDLSNKSDKSIIPKEKWNLLKNNLWSFAPQTRSDHPAPFPLELPKRCLILHSFVGDVVLDPFLGSGTTAIVAGKLKRRWVGIEISKEYCRLAVNNIKLARQQLDLFDLI